MDKKTEYSSNALQRVKKPKLEFSIDCFGLWKLCLKDLSYSLLSLHEHFIRVVGERPRWFGHGYISLIVTKRFRVMC